MPRTPRPIILIGAGGIVRDAHLPAYRLAGFEVAAIVNRRTDHARQLAAEFDIPAVYGSVEEAVARHERDVVYDIALPAGLHTTVIAQLPEGSTVLLQKPMGESIAEARAIRDACRSRGMHAAVNFQLRYAPFVIAARALVARGAIGDLTDLEVRVAVDTPWHLWTFLESVTQAETFYHSIHYLDLVRSFLGDPHAVYAKTLRHPAASRIDGTRSTYLLDYGDTVRVTITANHHAPWGVDHQDAWIQWSGPEGAIRATMGMLKNYPRGEADRFEVCRITGDGPTWSTLPIEGSWFPHAFIGTMASVMRVAEGTDDTAPTDIEDAFRTMLVVDAAVRSSRDGGTNLVSA